MKRFDLTGSLGSRGARSGPNVRSHGARKNFRPLLGSLAAIVLVGGCSTYTPFYSTVYLHSAETESLTAKAKEAIDQIDPAAFFTDQRAYLKRLLEETEKTVTTNVFAVRDRYLVTMIDATGPTIDAPGSLTGWEQMKVLIADRSKILLSSETAIDGDLERFTYVADDIVTEREDVKHQKRFVSDAVATFKRDGGKAENLCQQPIEKPMPRVNEIDISEAAKSAYLLLFNECKELVKVIEVLESSRQKLLLGVVDPDRSFNEIVAGWAEETAGLRKAEYTLWKLGQLIATQKALAQTAAAELKKLQTNYQCLVLAQSAPTLEDKIRAAAKQINDLLSNLGGAANLDSASATDAVVRAPAATAGTSTSRVAGTKCDDPDSIKVPSFDQLLAMAINKIGLNPDALKKLLKAQRFDLSIALGQTVKKVRSEFIESDLGQLVTALASGATGDQAADGNVNTRIALKTIRLISLLNEYRELEKSPEGAPTLDSLLVSMAYQRYKAENATILLSMLTRKRAIFALRRDAILSELRYLNAAKHGVKKLKEHLSKCDDAREIKNFAQIRVKCDSASEARKFAAQALSNYEDSWSRGQLQQYLSEYRETHLIRERNLAVDENTLVAWHGMLKPAIDQLAVYGAGGLKPELLARLASVLGLTGIAVGVND